VPLGMSAFGRYRIYLIAVKLPFSYRPYLKARNFNSPLLSTHSLSLRDKGSFNKNLVEMNYQNKSNQLFDICNVESLINRICNPTDLFSSKNVQPKTSRNLKKKRRKIYIQYLFPSLHPSTVLRQQKK
jgi:hypothetical protein